ncbi:uncharacterized protein DUF4307 [Knoellia remsis]|uniref:Uncharacterized protein DUF4307 n=1 Tax=Knoellia remsis TaxID=407159 RepID=A0A2T0UJN0_9MICO|nr:DUF4307 domain-containing protein [Knoellia remsis]PRY58151.1 uncharacterized protein DUF4307 [Knoellia remsis]
MPLPRPAPGTTRWWVIGGVLTAIALTYMTWFAFSEANALKATVTDYKVLSDSQIRLGYDVTRPDGSAVSCTLEAQDVRHGRVGTLTDDVPAGPKTVHREVTVRTSARAVTGVVASCDRPSSH